MFAGGSRTFWLGLGAENEVHCARKRDSVQTRKKNGTEPWTLFTVVKRTEGETFESVLWASSPGPFQRRHVRAAHRESHTLLFGAIGMWRCAAVHARAARSLRAPQRSPGRRDQPVPPSPTAPRRETLVRRVACTDCHLLH